VQRREFLQLAAAGSGVLLMGGIARLLLVARGGSGFAPPAAPTGLQQLTASLFAGHSEPQWPKAVGNNGHTYYGGINGVNGDVGILAIRDADLETSWTVLFPALGGEGTADLHDNSAVIVLPGSGKLATFTCRHADSTVRMRISTSALADDPLLADGFATSVSLDAQLGGRLYDYPCVILMDSKLWLFVRDIPAGSVDAHLKYATCSDLSTAATWSSLTDLYNNPGKTTYWQINATASLIHVLTFDDNEVDGGVANDLLHFTMDAAGDLFQSDGSAIVASLPLAPADIDTITASTGGHHLWNLELFAGNPVAAVTAYPDGFPDGDGFIRRIEWNGSAWTSSDVDSVTGTGLHWGMAIFPGDKDRIIAARMTSGVRDLIEYTFDGTWSESELSAGVSADDDWTFPVAARSAGRVKIVAMRGNYDSYIDWQTAPWAIVED
jgi:hypothetical protein